MVSPLGVNLTTKGVFGTTVEKPKVAVCPKCGEVSLYIKILNQ